jgi:predicted nucleotidyltransferase
MDLSRHTSLAGLAEAIGAVQEAARRLGLEVCVVGALARDLWLAFGAGIDTGRMTHDADFAAACIDWDTFDALAAELAGGGVERDPRIAHRFHHPNGTLVDIIPFGGVERADRTLAWPPDGNPIMNLLGFAEVAATAVPVRLPGELEIRVVPLEALALLKLLPGTTGACASRRKTPRISP